MRIAGIIAEYDPFHKGHEAHIQATRNPNGGGATHIVAVISGNFTQRGEPALVSKFRRAEMALSAGADLVLELPLPWAMAPAENFASGGVRILQALGCVEMLSFGSECGDVAALGRLAELSDQAEYKEMLKQVMAEGIPYAAASQKTAEIMLGKEGALPLSHPNNTLGIEYMRAAKRLGADFTFFTLQRQGALHHETAPKQGFAAASYLRNCLRNGTPEEAFPYLPDTSVSLIKEIIEAGNITNHTANLEIALLASLRKMDTSDFAKLPWLSEGLENRLATLCRSACSYDTLLDECKTKRYPLARLRRILWSALIGLSATDTDGLPPYIRVLGMNGRGREILSAANPTLPLITRTAQLDALDSRAQHIFQLECTATDLHGLAMENPLPCGTDHTEKLIVLP